MTIWMRRSPQRADPPTDGQITVTRLGQDGDGLHLTAEGMVIAIPGALPGETVEIDRAHAHGRGRIADLARVVVPSGERVAPPCAHFPECGGCRLQHWADAPYRAWKSARVADALRRAGFDDAPVATLVPSAPGTRRRVTLAVRRERGAVVLGLHARGSERVVDWRECAVLHPRLLSLLPPLRATLSAMAALRRHGSVSLNLLENGVDCLLRTDAAPTPRDRSALTTFATRERLPRISWAPGESLAETVCLIERPVARFGGVDVTPPPGAFMQATVAGERAILVAVEAGCGNARRVAELYAGCGTLTFGLSRTRRVAAFEGDAEAAAALSEAARRLPGGTVAVARRDLQRQPLLPVELRGFEAVVLDPPWNGAPEQIRQIAASAARRVVYVSCNPEALSRDAAVLARARFGCEAATPIDQFIWSAEVESVCVFVRRESSRRSRSGPSRSG